MSTTPDTHAQPEAEAGSDAVAAALTAAGLAWPDTAAELGLAVERRNDEHERDRVRAADGGIFYRSEYDGRWHRQGWSTASARRLHRDHPLSVLAEHGARCLADHLEPGPVLTAGDDQLGDDPAESGEQSMAVTLGLMQYQLREAETRRTDLIRWRRALARRAHDEGWSDARIAQALGVNRQMVNRLRAASG